MKHIFKLLIAFIIPFTLHAQDTTALKRQATIMADAAVKGDYATVVNTMYPEVVRVSGGKEKILNAVEEAMTQMKKEGFVILSATIGSPGKFYKAGTEIHCLIPETIIMSTPQGKLKAPSNLLAISSDGGKNWTFLDLNKSTVDGIPQIFPNFNHDLKIPEPVQPVLMN